MEKTIYCPFRCLLQRLPHTERRYDEHLGFLNLRVNVNGAAIAKIDIVIHIVQGQNTREFWLWENLLTWTRVMRNHCSKWWAVADSSRLSTWSTSLKSVCSKIEYMVKNALFSSWIAKITARAHHLPFLPGIDPVQYLIFNPSPLTEALPTRNVLSRLASSGTSRGFMVQCSVFFSQLWFLLSIS